MRSPENVIEEVDMLVEKFGVESGDPLILKRIKKRLDLKRVLACTKMAKKAVLTYYKKAMRSFYFRPKKILELKDSDRQDFVIASIYCFMLNSGRPWPEKCRGCLGISGETEITRRESR